MKQLFFKFELLSYVKVPLVIYIYSELMMLLEQAIEYIGCALFFFLFVDFSVLL
jgi:hypothetical protein